MTQTTVHCECGQAFGERCEWSGPASETVVVEYMPDHLRDSHGAAGDSGIYPENGAIRFRAERTCAERIMEHDGEWAQILIGNPVRCTACGETFEFEAAKHDQGYVYCPACVAADPELR